MGRIIIGNCFSLAGACFMAASCMTRNTRKVFFYQFLECVLAVIASFFFGSLSGAATMVLSAVRNLLVSQGKYSRRTMLVILALVLVCGTAANTRGLVGLLPVVATALYTWFSYTLTDLMGVRYNICLNLLLWVIYGFCILDLSTAISNSITLAMDIAAIFRLHREQRRSDSQDAAPS